MVDQRQAETVARLFNMAYNSAMLYGGIHQTTQEGSVPLFNLVKKYVDNKDTTLSIIIERESAYVENFCVDKIINVRRLVLHFKKAGLQSISFDSKLTLESMRHLFVVLSDQQAFRTVDDMKNALMIGHTEGIRLNYVVYRKMTVDEAIVDKGAAGIAASSAAAASGAADASVSSPFLTDTSDLVSIKQLLNQPQLLEKLSETDVRKTAGAPFQTVLQQLRSITGQIKNKETPSGFVSGQELAQAVYALKKDVARNLSSIKASVALEGSQALVLDEMEAMSQEVVLRIVRDEYKGGEVSIKRLAQIIRRIVPDVKELKRMLPRLKETLLAEGMQIPEYLKLVTEIRKELDSDGMAGLFEGAIEEIGVTMEELIGSIKGDPADVVRLILLAAEIRKTTAAEPDQVSTVLSDYIERVSRTLLRVQDPKEVSGNDGLKFIKTTITKIQNDLVDKLKSQGVQDTVLEKTSKKLSERMTAAVGMAKKEWLERFMENCRQFSETEMLSVVPTLMQNFEDTTLVRDAVTGTLVQKGYTETRIGEFFQKVSPRGPRQTQADLPRGVLNVNATIYFLEREIKRQQRYGTPFSCIIVTPVRLWSKRGAPLFVGENETRCIMPQIITFVRKMLRELDLVGSLGFVSRDIPFIILPMTDENGGISVVNRLEKLFSTLTFECNKEPMNSDFALTCATFDPATMSGYRPFLERALSEHKKREDLTKKSGIRKQPAA
jgi:hypothetical protein